MRSDYPSRAAIARITSLASVSKRSLALILRLPLRLLWSSLSLCALEHSLITSHHLLRGRWGAAGIPLPFTPCRLLRGPATHVLGVTSGEKIALFIPGTLGAAQ